MGTYRLDEDGAGVMRYDKYNELHSRIRDELYSCNKRLAEERATEYRSGRDFCKQLKARQNALHDVLAIMGDIEMKALAAKVKELCRK